MLDSLVATDLRPFIVELAIPVIFGGKHLLQRMTLIVAGRNRQHVEERITTEIKEAAFILGVHGPIERRKEPRDSIIGTEQLVDREEEGPDVPRINSA